MAIRTFFLVVAGINPDVSALLAPSKVAPKEAAIAVALKNCAAILAAYAVVIAYSF